MTLIGADGSGKTTVVQRLPEVLSRPCKSLYMGVSTSSSNRMLPTTRLYHAWKRASNPGHDDRGPPDPDRQFRRPRSLPKRIIKGLRHSVHYLILFSEGWYRQLLSWWLLRRRRGRSDCRPLRSRLVWREPTPAKWPALQLELRSCQRRCVQNAKSRRIPRFPE